MGLMEIKTGRLKRSGMFRRPVTVRISDVDVFDRVPVGRPFGSFPDGSDVFLKMACASSTEHFCDRQTKVIASF